MWDKLLSGRFLLTIACAIVFIWATMNKFLEAQAVAAILASVFASYFAQGQNSDNKPKPPTNGMAGAAVCLVICLFCAPAFADPVQVGTALSKIPALKQGVAYSVLDSRFNYIATFDVASKSGFNLEAGYAGIAKNTGDKLVAVISYDLFDAKKFGITWPVADLIKFRPGIYAGVGRMDILNKSAAKSNNEFDWGISASVIDIKF